MKMTSSNFNLFRYELKKALKGVEEEFGVEIKPGKIKYSSNSFEMQLEVSNPGSEEENYNSYVARWGNDFDDAYYKYLIGKFGATFTYKGNTYKINGVRQSRSKYDISTIETSTGKGVLWQGRDVAIILGFVPTLTEVKFNEN